MLREEVGQVDGLVCAPLRDHHHTADLFHLWVVWWTYSIQIPRYLVWRKRERGKEEGRKREGRRRGGKEEGRREGGSIALHSYSDYIHTHLGSKVRYDYKFLEYILWQDVSEASLFDVIRGDVDMVGPQVQVSG